VRTQNLLSEHYEMGGNNGVSLSYNAFLSTTLGRPRHSWEGNKWGLGNRGALLKLCLLGGWDVSKFVPERKGGAHEAACILGTF